MKRRIVFALIVAATLSLFSLIYLPGCGWIDPWLYWTWTCDSAGGGGSGAGLMFPLMLWPRFRFRAPKVAR